MNGKKKAAITAAVVVLLAAAAVVFILIKMNDGYREIRVERFEGDVELYRTQKGRNLDVYEGQKLINEDKVTVGADSLLVLQVDSDKFIASEADTAFEIEASGSEDAGRIRVNLLYGEALFTIENKLSDDSSFEVTTPHAVLGVRGTTFRVNYDEEQEVARLDVYEGCVRTRNDSGESMDVNAGESVIITEDEITPVITIANARVGDIVTYGHYEQDNDTGNGAEPIEWYVLSKEDGRAVLLSVYILAGQPYHSAWENITWEGCALRGWLNDEFYHAAFDPDEQAMIVDTQVVNEDNPTWHSDGGNDTMDRVFCLSMDEVMNRYSLEGGWTAEVTSYAAANGVSVYPDTNTAEWWLRTPGADNQNTIAVSFYTGNLTGAEYGMYGFTEGYGVRPTITVSY